jgi:DNA polymerase IV (archaeal DinB-like DNA polymerase)
VTNARTSDVTEKVIMHVDLDSFFPSCEELRDPMLKGKPHAVIMTDESKENITRGASQI